MAIPLADNALAAFSLACVGAYTIVQPFRLWFRSRNIRAHGWPPSYLDADGDRHKSCDCEEEPNVHLQTEAKT